MYMFMVEDVLIDLNVLLASLCLLSKTNMQMTSNLLKSATWSNNSRTFQGVKLPRGQLLFSFSGSFPEMHSERK